MAELIRRVSLSGKVPIDDMPNELEGEPEDIIESRVHFEGEAIVKGRGTTREGPETRRGIGEETSLLVESLSITKVEGPPEPDPELPLDGSVTVTRADLE